MIQPTLFTRDGPGLRYLMSLEQWKGTGDFGLQRLSRVMQLLGNPQDLFRTFHVAGTNGKGSVSAALASILSTSGKKIGLYTSPHLTRINERIVIDGFPVSDEFFDTYALVVSQVAEKAGIKLSFFEAITALCFLGFHECGIDSGVIEVGLGGRLDATNVIKSPVVSVIVTIDFDHTEYLGDSLQQIATEKGGIIKPGSPVLLGGMEPTAKQTLIDLATERGSPVYSYGEDFKTEIKDGLSKFISGNDEIISFSPTLEGAHQVINMSVAIKAALIGGISPQACSNGIKSVFWPARLEEIPNYPCKIVLDSAHNPAGIRSLISFLDTKKLSDVRICFGALKSKNWLQMIELLKPYSRSWALLRPDSATALEPEEIMPHLSGSEIINYKNDYQAFINEQCRQTYSSPLIICGSMYMGGKIRSLLTTDSRRIW